MPDRLFESFSFNSTNGRLHTLQRFVFSQEIRGARIGTHPFLDLWKRANEKTDLPITPQTLREWFCMEMVSKGVNYSYADAFCGKVPYSISARHYLDYSQLRS